MCEATKYKVLMEILGEAIISVFAQLGKARGFKIEHFHSCRNVG
jgi:hypothetical protein